MLRKMPLMFAIALIAACTPHPQAAASHDAPLTQPGTASVAPAKASDAQAAVQPEPSDHRSPPLQPPTQERVLYLISDKEGDSPISYETVNGSWIHFWYGIQFDLGGKHYYTGFAWETPELFGDELVNHFAAPGTKVTLAHATFFANPPASEEPWHWEGTEPYIGEFGGGERGNEPDRSRAAETYVTDDGRLVLAVPTWSLQSGVSLFFYDILVFDPKESQDVDATHWTYLDTLWAGSDNSTSCGEIGDTTIPCETQTSSLAFVKGHGLPAIRIAVTSVPDRARTEHAEYRFDMARKSYVAAP